jgi:hypothetical protein
LVGGERMKNKEYFTIFGIDAGMISSFLLGASLFYLFNSIAGLVLAFALVIIKFEILYRLK